MAGSVHATMPLARMTICVDRVSVSYMELFSAVMVKLGFETEKLLLVDRRESFYYYAMRTRHDNANRSTGLFCFDKNRVHFRKLWIDTATKPMIARVEVGKSELLSENPKKRDKRFAEMIEKCCGEESYSNLYLIGEGFDKEWAVDSLTALC